MWSKWNRSTKPLTRPVKQAGERRRRLKVQKKRLANLGLPAEKIAKMNSKQVRDLLKRPAKLAKKK